MQYSVAQAGNIAALAGLLAMVASYAGFTFITSKELEAVIGAVLTLGGVLVSWYDQWKSGQTTIGGFRTPAARATIASQQLG